MVATMVISQGPHRTGGHPAQLQGAGKVQELHRFGSKDGVRALVLGTMIQPMS